MYKCVVGEEYCIYRVEYYCNFRFPRSSNGYPMTKRDCSIQSLLSWKLCRLAFSLADSVLWILYIFFPWK